MTKSELAKNLDLTDDEASRLVLNLARTRGETGFTEDEGCVVIDWAQQAKLDAALLELVLCGEIGILVKDGEVAFSGRMETLEALQ